MAYDPYFYFCKYHGEYFEDEADGNCPGCLAEEVYESREEGGLMESIVRHIHGLEFKECSGGIATYICKLCAETYMQIEDCEGGR